MYGDIRNIKEENSKFDISSISEELVYAYYLGVNPKLDKKFISPFTVNGRVEKDPSLAFYVKNGKLLFKCFSSSRGGDCINLVEMLFNLNFSEAVKLIQNDLYSSQPLRSIKIQNRDISIDEIHRVSRMEKQGSRIEVVVRDFDMNDAVYWGEYGLNNGDLTFWDVKPCKEVWLDGFIWYEYRKTDPCYRYRFDDKYKIYRPKRSGKGKWLSNTTKDYVQGLSYLPEKGELLVITKSYKDIMVLDKHINIKSIAFGSESTKITKEAVDYLYNRFDNIVIFYDNDEAGLRLANELTEETGISNVHIPTEYNVTDTAALYKNYGKQVFTDVVKELLKF